MSQNSEKIQNALLNLDLANHLDLFDSVAQDIGLAGYVKHWEYDYLENDMSSRQMRLAKIRALNAYEGAMNNKASIQETKALFLGSLFYREKRSAAQKMLFFKINQKIEEKKQVSASIYEMVEQLICFNKSKKKNLKEKIFIDCANMLVYNNDVEIKTVHFFDRFDKAGIKFRQENFEQLEFSNWLRKLSVELTCIKHQTQWSNIKAFKLNLPNQVKKLILELNGSPI
jgi:hypothetical protein